MGIPGHYKANKSVSFVELRGFRDKLRLAGWADESDEERDQEEEEDEAGCSYMDARHKRKRSALLLAWPLSCLTLHGQCIALCFPALLVVVTSPYQ